MVSQWAETTFEALLVNRVMPSESPFPALVNSLLSGGGSRALTLYMEGYTLTLYLGFAAGAGLLALRLFRCKAQAWPHLYAPLALMVAVLGGFLYHMLFEAKSQYLMIYLPMMAPLGAWGLGMAPRRRQGSSRAMMRIFSTRCRYGRCRAKG